MKHLKKLILAGCGHANLQVLHSLGPLRERLGINLVVLNNTSFVVYSGMLPGLIGGMYKEEEMRFDLRKMCKRWGIPLHESEIIKFDFEKKIVSTKDSNDFQYDYLSINLGSSSVRFLTKGSCDNFLPIRPLGKFLLKLQEFKEKENSNPDIVIIGGGAGGIEMAISMSLAFSSSIKLVTGTRGILPDYPERTKYLAQNALRERGVHCIQDDLVEVFDQWIFLKSGERIIYDLAVSTVSGTPPECLPDGALAVNDYLQVEGYPEVFAAGDCTMFQKTKLPKSGVFAVKQGAILVKNLQCLIDGKILVKYRPQSKYLSLILSGKKDVIFSRGNVSLRSRFFWYLKNYIDKKFMSTFS